MPLFEVDATGAVASLPAVPQGGFGTEERRVVDGNLAGLIGEQVFPVAQGRSAREPYMLALDAAGLPVVIDVVAELTQDSLTRALKFAGAAGQLTRADLAARYPGGAAAFQHDVATFYDNVPLTRSQAPPGAPGARLILLCQTATTEILDAVGFLQQPGSPLTVLQLAVVHTMDGRRYIDVSPLDARRQAADRVPQVDAGPGFADGVAVGRALTGKIPVVTRGFADARADEDTPTSATKAVPPPPAQPTEAPQRPVPTPSTTVPRSTPVSPPTAVPPSEPVPVVSASIPRPYVPQPALGSHVPQKETTEPDKPQARVSPQAAEESAPRFRTRRERFMAEQSVEPPGELSTDPDATVPHRRRERPFGPTLWQPEEQTHSEPIDLVPEPPPTPAYGVGAAEIPVSELPPPPPPSGAVPSVSSTGGTGVPESTGKTAELPGVGFDATSRGGRRAAREATSMSDGLADVDDVAEPYPPTGTQGRLDQDDPDLASLARVIGAPTSLVWARPRRRQRYDAVLHPDGTIELSDGGRYRNPDLAASAVSGIASANGWSVWRIGEDGPTLTDAFRAYNP